MKIDISHFRTWQKEPITKAFFTCLGEMKEGIEFSLKNPDVIMSENSSKKLARLVGSLDVLNYLLNITFEDVKDEERSDADGV